MPDARPVYLLAPPGPARSEVEAALDGVEVHALDGVTGLHPLEGREPGVVILVEETLGAEAVLDAVQALARGRGEWTAVLARREGEGWTARTVGLGYAHPVAEVAALAREEEVPSLLELRRTLTSISRARHDINNPLTSGLAETQLLLMDVQDPQIREPLETIQEQFRRIRDLVGGITWLRHAE